jgi:hypothetical protein
LWAPEEYEKLRRYDALTGEQPTAVFLCHQKNRGAAEGRVCAGWAGCHDGRNLRALRIAALGTLMSIEDIEAAADYISPVPLFASGREAADHGLAEVAAPGVDAVAAISKLARARGDSVGRRSPGGGPAARTGDDQRPVRPCEADQE